MTAKAYFPLRLKVYFLLQMLWALFLIYSAIMTLGLSRDVTLFKILFLCFACGLLLASISIFLEQQAGWKASLVLLIVYWFLHGWRAAANFFYNWYAFFSDHPLYQDSPATIIVLTLNAIFGFLPALILSLIMIIDRKTIFNSQTK